MSEMTQEQINRNFVAVNEWMKLIQKRLDELTHENEGLRLKVTTLEQRMMETERKANAAVISLIGNGPTVA